MTSRVLLCGIGLFALQLGSGLAQVLPADRDSPAVGKPAAVDGSPKAPGSIPEIIRQPDGSDNLPPARAIADPSSVLTPPTVNLQFLRAIRLDWDHMGSSRGYADR
jgi:hypothetical protein